MFDLKKRNSLTLTGSRESEEFRRVAVRRKVRSVVGDCPTSDVSSGVSGSYSRDQACDIRGLKPDFNLREGEFNKRSPVNKSPLKPQVPPKPTHLQSPPDRSCSPIEGRVLPHTLNVTGHNKSPHRIYAGSASCVNLSQICLDSTSPVGVRGSHLQNGVPVSPSRQAQWINIPGLVLGSPSPGKRGIQSCSPLREGGHSPAKLSPRNRSPLMGKLRTPSPVQAKMAGYISAKSSKSWLGLHRIPNNRTESQEKSVGKSLSVPDLIVYMHESSIPIERSPLKPLPSPNCDASDTSIKASAKHRLSHPASERHRSSSSKEVSPGQMNGMMSREERLGVDVREISDNKEEVHDSQCSRLCTEDAAGEKSRDEQNEEGGEAQDESNAEQKLYKIANELLQTERAYVARLHLLDQVFSSRLTEEAGRGSFPPEVIRNIFSNTSSIYSFHSQFLLPDLENCISHWTESSGLGKVLLKNAPFLRMYADYVKNFDQAMELVRMWTERSSAFRNIIQDIQCQEMCGNLTLQHHMLEPVQRVPRYEMLLKDYLKRLPVENPDYELAQKSLEAISMAATHSNRAIHKAENLKRLLEIYEMLGEEEEVVNPTNEFLREGRLLKLAARNTSAMERHLFLFNNFLLCCSPRFSLVGQRFTIRCRIGVESMEVQQTINEDHPYTFQVSGKEKILELQANSEQERDEWIKEIQKSIDEFQKKNETFKLASKETTVEEQQGEELGRRAPRWIRDNEVTLCMTCWEPFNALTRRRHHCRACGFVVCWKCSDNKAALEYDGNRLNKVCKSCYAILISQRGERADGKKRRILEGESAPASSDCVMSGFLRYGDDPVIGQRPWSVVTRADPPMLHLYAVPKDPKPQLSIPLLGCHVEASPPDLQGPHSFCLIHSKTTHTFSCDGADLKQNWLTVLKAAATGKTPARSPSISENSVANGVCSGEELVLNGNEENHS